MIQPDSVGTAGCADRSAPPRASMLRRWLILTSVLTLAIAVATRFSTAAAASDCSQTTVSSHAPTAKRQHLVSDGLHWTAPPSTFTLFEPDRRSNTTLPAVFPINTFYAGNCPHNRPPPSR